jgi:hypothetical protein
MEGISKEPMPLTLVQNTTLHNGWIFFHNNLTNNLGLRRGGVCDYVMKLSIHYNIV